MRLLIITQVVDRRHPILGFFRRWIEECATRCDHVTVIGQEVREENHPANVTVLSLEKEKGRSRFSQIIRFWSLTIRHRREYDAVLVHMTPVWMVLGGPLWIMLRKRRYLWYEVRRGGWMLTLGVLFSQKVFSATASGLPFRSAKNLILGHGIDTDFFCPGDPAARDPHQLCAVGRITRIKHLDLILRTLAGLPPVYRLIIVGPVVTPDDREYCEELRAIITEQKIGDRVTFTQMTPDGIRDLFRRSHLLLHAAGGGLDKVLLEAMACGSLVVTTSVAASGIPDACRATEDTVTDRTRALLALTPDQAGLLTATLRDDVVRNHHLSALMDRMVREMDR